MTVSFAIVLYLNYSTIIWLELQYTELCIHYTLYSTLNYTYVQYNKQ